MHRPQAIVLLLFSVALLTGALAVSATSETPASGDQAPPINTTENATEIEATSESTTAPQQYIVTATSATAVNQTALAQYGEVGTQADARVELRMLPANVSAVEHLPWVTDVRPTLRPAPADIPGSTDGRSIGVESLHQQGVTGDGVKIGIIDLGFDLNEIDDVQAHVSFRNTSGSTDHGTSVAKVVTQTAPDSQLYLVSAESSIDHQRAINYLVNEDVDIIVYSIGWPAIEDDGEHFLTDEITTARQQGTLFVASAGNEAERHWEGDFQDGDRDGILEWGGSIGELNALLGRNTTVDGGEVTVYIRWEERGAPSRYRAALYNPDTERYVAVGQDRSFGTETNRYSRLATTVQSQQLALVVENTAGPADDEIEIVFFSGPREIERTVPSSSITAPADVPAAVSVGAYERGKYVQQSGMASYSSRGPTDDGRRGVDVTGYTNIDTGGSRLFAGTSAAAPYVGGVAALVEDRYKGDASPAEVETALTSTSNDIRRSGPDTVSGAGVVNAVDAVGTAVTPTPTPTPPQVTAEAGQNQTVSEGSQIQLDGSGSSAQTYSWSQISGPSVTLQDPNTASPTFTAPSVNSNTIFSFELTVTDGNDGRDTDTVQITVTDTDDDDGEETTPFPNGIPGVGPQQPGDPNNDGEYEDVNGDGTAEFDDAVALAFADTSQLNDQQRDALDFDGDGDVDFDDAIQLAFDA